MKGVGHDTTSGFGAETFEAPPRARGRRARGKKGGKRAGALASRSQIGAQVPGCPSARAARARAPLTREVNHSPPASRLMSGTKCSVRWASGKASPTLHREATALSLTTVSCEASRAVIRGAERGRARKEASAMRKRRRAARGPGEGDQPCQIGRASCRERVSSPV